MTQALTHWLEALGIVDPININHNPDRSVLVSNALCNNEGQLTHDGALGVLTSPYTGRSPDDKYIVDYQDRSDLWWGKVNRPLSPEAFTRLQSRIVAYLGEKHLYIIDCFIGADPQYRKSIRLVTEFAWQALAAENLFIYTGTKHDVTPEITILAAPDFQADPEVDGVRSQVAICLDLKEKTILVAGSKYDGEIKKSAFSMMNALLPDADILPMHCSANVGKRGDVALFFGLSGTGKTTLSSTPERQLVGDDEHGWGDNGVFNFEGGCYAKTIRLKHDLEPVIWSATNQFGTVLENVVINTGTGRCDFDDARYTENTRAAYPLSQVTNIVPSGMAGHPNNIFFLTADAFGVLPPIAKLTHDEAIYYFLSGYTSKVAGTERGLGQQPKATFSTCFGEPFLPLLPQIYADLFRSRLEKYDSHVWLINTGWTAGGYHTGYRMPLPFTRSMINWVLSGDGLTACYQTDPVFGLRVPIEIPGIPQELFIPKNTWQDSQSFDEAAEKLRVDFETNYKELCD